MDILLLDSSPNVKLSNFSSSEKSRNDLVDALESVTYLIGKDDDINLDIFYEVRLDAVIV